MASATIENANNPIPPWNKSSSQATEHLREFVRALELSPDEIKVLNWLLTSGAELEKGGQAGRAKVSWITISITSAELKGRSSEILEGLGFIKTGGLWSNSFARNERKKCGRLTADIHKNGSEIDIRGVEWPEPKDKSTKAELEEQE